MNLRFLILSLMAMLTSPAVAATVSITLSTNGPGDTPYASSFGSLLNFGSVIRVGFFDLSSPGILSTLQTSNVFGDVNALFTPLGEGITNAGSILESGASGNQLVINDLGTTGNVFGQIVNIESTYCTPGSDLSVWVFNNADPLLASEWGIFSASTGWEFPLALGSQTLSTSEIDTVIRGTDTGTQFQLSGVSVVPEPGSWLLLMVGVAVLNYRRLRSVNGSR